MQIVYPDPIIVPYGGSGQVYVTWTNGTSAKLNGKDYTKEKAKKMIANYLIGLVVISVILLGVPLIMSDISALISG